jgi:hypothetical protein
MMMDRGKDSFVGVGCSPFEVAGGMASLPERVGGEDVGDFESDEMGGDGGGGGVSPLRRSADSPIALTAASPAATFLETVRISARIVNISWLLPREVGFWRELKSWAKSELVGFRNMMMVSSWGI